MKRVTRRSSSTVSVASSAASASASERATTFCCTEDCESSFTMKIRCRRGQLLFAFPFLAVIFVATNGWLFLEHSRFITKPLTTTHNSPETTLAMLQKQQQQRGGPVIKKMVTIDHTRQQQQQQTEQGVDRQAVESFFNERIGSATDNNNAAGDGADNQKQQNQGQPQTGRRKRRKNKQQQTVEAPPPRPESLAANATFSACLLIRDDNEILPEWLAYHYHVIGLRHLIVAVDPLSSESPSAILEKWRNQTDLEVLEWTDAHFMPANFLKQHKPPTKYMQKKDDFDFNISHEALVEISNHRYRQRVFLAKCMKAHRDKGNSWVMHIDTDEYIVASKLLRQMKPDYLDMPNMTQPNSVLRLLQQAVRKTAQPVSYPCISMLRVLFGSVESRPEEVDLDVPDGFNASSFETLRWRYHALPHNMTIHGNPKVILDVAAIPEQYFPNEVVYSIHRPVEDFCHKNKDLTFTSFRKQPIAVNHYLGSWERYAGRNDKRRSREVYNAKANVRRGKDDGVREWLMGFTQLVGPKVAAQLLGSAYLSSFTAMGAPRSSPLSSSAGVVEPEKQQQLVLDDGSAIVQPIVVANDFAATAAQ